MEQKAFLKLLVVLLCLSYAVFASAVPTTRSLMSSKVDPAVQDQLPQDLESIRTGEELNMEEGFEERRMMLETEDYQQPRANCHDPRHPCKA